MQISVITLQTNFSYILVAITSHPTVITIILLRSFNSRSSRSLSNKIQMRRAGYRHNEAKYLQWVITLIYCSSH